MASRQQHEPSSIALSITALSVAILQVNRRAPKVVEGARARAPLEAPRPLTLDGHVDEHGALPCGSRTCERTTVEDDLVGHMC